MAARDFTAERVLELIERFCYVEEDGMLTVFDHCYMENQFIEDLLRIVSPDIAAKLDARDV